MRQKDKGKEIVLIADNASIHKSRKVKQYLKDHPSIHIFYLPPYSPQYNPIELFWKWLKPKIYGFSSIGGLGEIIKRFRTWVWHYNRGKLCNSIQFGLKAYVSIL